jgi:hypothetical protein
MATMRARRPDLRHGRDLGSDRCRLRRQLPDGAVADLRAPLIKGPRQCSNITS